MSQTYSGGGYTVTIAEDGSLLVKPGDSVSKYSMAIHGDFQHLDEYRRKIGSQLLPLVNINVISAGETLFHAPSMPAGGHVVVTEADPFPKLPNGEYDIQKILLDNNIPLSYRDKLVWLINGGRVLQGGVAFLGIWGAGWGAGLALTSGLTGPLLGTLGGLYGLWKARNFGIQTAGLRGTVYGTVAWAFHHPAPSLPENMEKLILAGNASGDLENYRSVFEQAARQSYGQMRSCAQQQGWPEEDLKVAVQAFGKGRSEQLAAAMMVDVADYYYSGDSRKRAAFLQPWSWYPKDKYAGRPSYNAEISQRYGWG